MASGPLVTALYPWPPFRSEFEIAKVHAVSFFSLQGRHWEAFLAGGTARDHHRVVAGHCRRADARATAPWAALPLCQVR